jgi:hypothetical protein
MAWVGMERRGRKEEAEAVLRELPAVVGAFVREDVYGHPREIHLLIRPGPEPRHLARDIRNLLEERLGIPIDQRIISIAQLARDPESGEAPAAVPAPAGAVANGGAPGRLRFAGSSTRRVQGRVQVRVRLELDAAVYEGEAEELEAGSGRARAGAEAALRAASVACGGRASFEVEAVSVVRVSDRGYVIVNALSTSPQLGRRPLSLAGAQELDPGEPELAGALAALKAANRVLALLLAAGGGGGGLRPER